MSIYLDTRGHSTLAIGICARCSVKYPLDELRPDPNSPGLMCCPDGCLDVLDPYRLAPRAADRITVDYPRPDVDIYTEAPMPIYANAPFGISPINPARTWQPNTVYNVGDSITPQNVDDPNVQLPQYWFLCIVGGTSGATPPVWATHAGVIMGPIDLVSDSLLLLLSDAGIQLTGDFSGSRDGTVSYLCLGIYPN